RVPAWAVTVPARCSFYVWEIVLTSAVVQLGLALPMVVYFHRVGLSGLSANAFIVPLMGVVVPIGFLAVVTGWMWVGQIVGWGLAAAQAIVNFHAGFEPVWRIPAPPLWLAIALSLALIAASIVRTRAARIAAAVTVGLLLAVMLWHPFAPAVHSGELELTAIDVGQGDSLLVVFPDGKTMVIDGGGVPVFGRAQGSKLDTGEDVIAPYLWDRGIRRLDVIVVSHAHEDHAGGLPALVTDFRPREVWTGATPPSGTWDRVRDAALHTAAAIKPLHSPARFAFAGTAIQALPPTPAHLPPHTPHHNHTP